MFKAKFPVGSIIEDHAVEPPPAPQPASVELQRVLVVPFSLIFHLPLVVLYQIVPLDGELGSLEKLPTTSELFAPKATSPKLNAVEVVAPRPVTVAKVSASVPVTVTVVPEAPMLFMPAPAIVSPPVRELTDVTPLLPPPP